MEQNKPHDIKISPLVVIIILVLIFTMPVGLFLDAFWLIFVNVGILFVVFLYLAYKSKFLPGLNGKLVSAPPVVSYVVKNKADYGPKRMLKPVIIGLVIGVAILVVFSSLIFFQTFILHK